MPDDSREVRYWWGHFVFGADHLAWCNVCDTGMATWKQPWGQEGLPSGIRRKVNEHEVSHAP